MLSSGQLPVVILHTYPPMKMEQTECSETSAYKIQTPGNYPEESIQHSEQGEILKKKNTKKQMPKWIVLTEVTVKAPALRFGFSLHPKA
jgi:hypothetical protein